MKEREQEASRKQKSPYTFHGEEQPFNFIFYPEFFDREPEPGERIGYVSGQTHLSSDITTPQATLYWELDVEGNGMVVCRVNRETHPSVATQNNISPDVPNRSSKKRKKEQKSQRIRPSRRK